MGIANYARILGVLVITALRFSRLRAQESDAARIYHQSSKSVLLLLVKSADPNTVSQGTGFPVEGGKVITNIQDGIPLIDLGRVKIPAKIESTDDLNDLAIFTFEAEISAHPLLSYTYSTDVQERGTRIQAVDGNGRELTPSNVQQQRHTKQH